MAMRIGNEINQALAGLDRQIQIAKNSASLAVITDKKDKPNATDAAAEGEENGEATAVEATEDRDSTLGNNIDVTA